MNTIQTNVPVVVHLKKTETTLSNAWVMAANQSFSRVSFAELGIWLNKTTKLQIKTAIMDLVLVTQQEKNTIEGNYSDNILEAMTAQIEIGLYPFLCSFFIPKIEGTTKAILHGYQVAKMCTKMGIHIINKTHEIIYDMWSHQNKILNQKDNVIRE